MRILGLHTVWHDTGACLIDGEYMVAICEERLSRIKYDGAFPSLSIDYVVSARGLSSINDVDLVVLDNIKDKQKAMEKEVRKFGYKGEIHFISHHDAHAAAAFFQSGFMDAAILIVDGTGSMASIPETGHEANYYMQGLPEPFELHSYYRGLGDRLHLIDRTVSGADNRGSIGMLYDGISSYCNFGSFGAGKVMGLAPYGGKNPDYERIEWREVDGRIIVDGRDKMIPKHFAQYRDSVFNGLPMREDQELPDDKYTELAHKAQYNCEQALLRMADHLYDITRSESLCICGGIGLNSVSNHKVLVNSKFKNIFIHPACSDTGIALGNALYGHHIVKNRPEKFVMKNAYLGRAYSDSEIKHVMEHGTSSVSNDAYTWTHSDTVCQDTAQLLADGKIIGWFQGGSEIGPRALGHRSLLCDPRPDDMKDKVNIRVKHREWWRPFAPSVLEDHFEDYFDLDQKSPYMLLIADVKKEKQAEVPAIAHVDGTARVQTVNAIDNDRYFELISAFYELTGMPMLLNTSFNVAGEAIVETPADALDCVMGTEIDHLIIGDYIVTKI